MFQWSKEHFLANICQSQCKRPFRKITQPDTLLKQGLFTCIIRYIHFKGTLSNLFGYLNPALGQRSTESSMMCLFRICFILMFTKKIQKNCKKVNDNDCACNVFWWTRCFLDRFRIDTFIANKLCFPKNIYQPSYPSRVNIAYCAMLHSAKNPLS